MKDEGKSGVYGEESECLKQHHYHETSTFNGRQYMMPAAISGRTIGGSKQHNFSIVSDIPISFECLWHSIYPCSST
jgi:hypothetical protein